MSESGKAELSTATMAAFELKYLGIEARLSTIIRPTLMHAGQSAQSFIVHVCGVEWVYLRTVVHVGKKTCD